MNSAAQPGPGEVDADGNMTESFWDRMFDGSYFGEDSAARLSAVWAAVYVISSAVTLMPLRLYRREGDSTREERKHRLSGFLQDAPGDRYTWESMREGLMYQLLLRGNAFTSNFWRGGHLREVFLWEQGQVDVDEIKETRRLGYRIPGNDYGIEDGVQLRPAVAHFKGLTSAGVKGISPIQHCRLSLRGASALARFGTETAEQGGPIRGIITGATPLRNTEASKARRRQWSQALKEAQKDKGIPIFEGSDMKFQNVSMTMQDAQFLEQMRFSVEEVARIFNVPPHQIQHLERATNNNIALMNQEFYKSSLLPWIRRVGGVMNRNWLTEGDRRQGYFIGHDPEEFLEADLEKWSTSMAKQVAGGIRTPNEARAKRGLKSVEGGDELRVPANTVRATAEDDAGRKQGTSPLDDDAA